MVGSTALSAKIDPELLGGVIRRYQDATAGAIGRYGGFVAKFMGDGVLAYFGFPRAFEDAAERAVRAALGILAEVGDIELPDGTRLQARIGIATGLVVVGEIIGTGSAQERTIVGETPNLAARLQALAQPDSILVSESTQRLLGGLFQLTHTGEHDLKGFSRPVPVWQVCGEASVESRFAAIRSGESLPLIGRTHEMGLMCQRWQLARQGEGQIVTVTGEAGIGKSRAIEALQQELGAEPHVRVNLQCSPYHSDSTLYPVIQYLHRALCLAPTDVPETRIEKLRSWLAGAPGRRNFGGRVAGRTAIDSDGRSGAGFADTGTTQGRDPGPDRRPAGAHGQRRSRAGRTGRRALDRRHHAGDDDTARR